MSFQRLLSFIPLDLSASYIRALARNPGDYLRALLRSSSPSFESESLSPWRLPELPFPPCRFPPGQFLKGQSMPFRPRAVAKMADLESLAQRAASQRTPQRGDSLTNQVLFFQVISAQVAGYAFDRVFHRLERQSMLASSHWDYPHWNLIQQGCSN
jgi:hypothetical protein